jgi:CheY-like chemotaxis protein
MILVVDDHPDCGDAFSRLLRLTGYPSRTVTSGSDALTFIRAHPAGQALLVVLDEMMPDMSGMDTLRAIRGDATIAATSVMFFTAGFDLARREEAMTRGALAWLFKGRVDVSSILGEIGRLYEKVGGLKTAAQGGP